MTGFISRVFVNLIVSLAGICELIFQSSCVLGTELRQFQPHFRHRVCRQRNDLGKPTVCVSRGVCKGAGLDPRPSEGSCRHFHHRLDL